MLIDGPWREVVNRSNYSSDELPQETAVLLSRPKIQHMATGWTQQTALHPRPGEHGRNINRGWAAFQKKASPDSFISSTLETSTVGKVSHRVTVQTSVPQRLAAKHSASPLSCLSAPYEWSAHRGVKGASCWGRVLKLNSTDVAKNVSF